MTPLQPLADGRAAAAPSRPARPPGATARDAPPAAVHAAAVPAHSERIERAVQEIRQALAPVAQSLQFSIDKETGKTVVRIVDAATQEVIRQIPSEEILAIARALDRLQGVLFEDEA